MKRFFSPDLLAVYLAGTAIILSQLPPIYQLFQKPEAEITADGWLSITHALGRPQVYLPVTVSNDGSATLTVEEISCSLMNLDNGNIWPMKVTSFVDQSTVQQFQPAREIPIGRLRVLPNSRWSETVHCAVNPTADQLSRLQLIGLQMTDYLNSQPRVIPATSEPVEFPQDIWMPAQDMFEEAFILEVGSYAIEISILTDEAISSSHVSSSFILDASDISILRRHLDQYKYGGGVIFPIPNSLSVTKVEE
ncbi:hypothetical protein BC777_0107 [Yoonia maricola]|uniref:Uncharacterized protein n=1 Tax=Yoonia maricola TaxID=420999 RepID=A0A2M8WK48_9RHOB|nr:hypothetical protein [Yoonia maricola]PJI91283.1 hypothetical protein BC777_0107 [Yoonia maricola]